MPQADYTYDRQADCFVVTDDKGNEIFRTTPPHVQSDRDLVQTFVSKVNCGNIIFPTTGDTTKP